MSSEGDSVDYDRSYDSLDPDPGRPTKRKRSRAALSCAECRRLKTKCDRQVPCGGCIKRGCAELCPHGSSGSLRSLLSDRQRLEARVKELESQSSGHPIPGPSDHHTIDPRTVERSHMLHMSDFTPPQGVSYVSPITSGSFPLHQPFDGEPSPASSREAMLQGSMPMPWDQNRGGHFAQASPYSNVRHLPEDPGLSEMSPLDNYGTLVVTAGGGSKFLGPAAASQWLREGANENTRSRLPSPVGSLPPDGVKGRTTPQPVLFGYPVTGPASMTAYVQIRDLLPPEEEVQVLVDCYFRYVAWNSTPIIRSEIDTVLESIYHASSRSDAMSLTLGYQKLALIFSVISFGTAMNMEHPPNDPMSEKYLLIAQRCLFNGRFLVYNTIIGLQALSIMAKILTYTDSPGRHDLSWQLWGIATRMCLAMGLHRDGAQWKLSPSELNQRRRIFWETFNLDVFRSFSYDRPPAISPIHFDTKYPEDLEQGPNGALGFFDIKFRMTRLSYDALDESLRVVPSSFTRIMEVWDQACLGEMEVPFYLRCRAAMRAMVSRYPTPEAADEQSPMPSRTDLRNTFRQHALAMNYIGSVFTLLRPYFVQALNTHPEDPTQSPYAKAYLAIIERSSMMVAVLKSIYSLFPWASTRHWFFWADTFSAAVCLATVCIVSPHNPLVGLCLSDLNDVISLYEAIRDSYPGGGLRENLKCLHWLLRQYYERSSNGDPIQPYITETVGGDRTNTSDDHMDLVGWKTRLIEISEVRAVTRGQKRASQPLGLGDGEAGPSARSSRPGSPIKRKESEMRRGGEASLMKAESRSASGGPQTGFQATDDVTSILLQQLLETPLGQGPPPAHVNVDPVLGDHGLDDMFREGHAGWQDPFEFDLP